MQATEVNTFAGVGSGKFRKPWKIKEFLATKNVRIKDIATEAGVSSSVASNTIQGVKNNQKVLDALLGLGCPSEYLGLGE